MIRLMFRYPRTTAYVCGAALLVGGVAARGVWLP